MADSDTSKEAGATGLVDLKAKVMTLEETIHFYEQELNRSRTQTALMRALLSATDPSNQKDVFHAIVYQLAGSLNARHAVLGAIHGEGPERRVDTIAVMVDGEFATNFSYRLEGMPCAQTLHERILYYEAGLQDRFPDAELVKNLGAESYCGFPLYGSSGRLIGILAVLDRQPLSISEDLHPLLMLYAARAGAELQRQQAESARRESDRRIRLTQFAVDHAVDGVVWADDKERLIYANESICRSLGYSQEELLLLGIPDIEVRPDRICSMQRHEDIKQGRAAASESWFRRKDGTQFPVEVSFTYLEQEGRGYICGIARDITERKRVEQERAQALYDLRNIMETVPDFMFTLDCQGNLVRWNSRVAEVTGYTPEELWLKHALAFVPPEERDRTAAAIQQALATGYAELDGHLLTKTHVLIPYHWTGAALRNPQGDIIGITGVGRDVSEKKRVEQRMLEQREHLVMAQALAHLGSWDWHLTTGEVAWSDEQYRIFGHEPGSMCVTYDTFLTALLPEDHDRVLKAVNDALAGRTPYNIECRIVRPNGEVRVVHCMGEVRRDDEGRALTMDGTSLDITDRKNIEEALRASDERWHLAVCGSNDGIWDWKILTNEIFFSSRWKSMRGFQDHELPNSLDEWRSRIHPEDLDRVLQAIDRYLAGACSEYCEEYRVERKDGTYMWILDRGMALWADDGTPLRMAGSESDITERKRAEQGLKESEERYRMLVDLSPSGIFVYCEGAIVYVNHAACRILGAETPEEVLMHPTLHFVHPDCHEAVMDGANALLMNGAPVRRVERKYLKVDRTVIDVEVEAAPITWNGKPAIQGMFSDITDRKRAEQVLRESEELFAKAFRSSPDPMVISELDSGLCLDVNDACLIGFGYRRDDVVGRTGDVIGHWPTSEDRLRFVKRLKQDGPIRNFETAIRTASGEFRDCLVSAELIEYHGKSCMVTVGKDITERKRAEEALRASEERYARATAVGKVGVWELDVTTGMYHGDANLKALFGYGPEELSTDPYMWLQLVHPDDRSTAMHAWEQVLGGSTDEYHYEIRMIRKDGMTIWTEVRGHALRDHQNSVTHLIGATVDITERHDAQVDLRRTDDHLRALIQVSPLAIVTTDADGNVLSWNPGAEALFGWTEREVGGHPFPWLSGEETSDLERTWDELIQADEAKGLELRRLRKDGSPVDMKIWSARLRNEGGDTTHWVLFIDDVTELKEAHLNLQRSERQLRTVLDALPVGVWFTDARGEILYGNPVGHQIWSQVSRVGLPDERSEKLWWEKIEKAESPHRWAIGTVMTRGRVLNEMIEIETRDGERKTIRNSAVPVRDEGGDVLGAIVLNEDITDRMRAEEALRQHHALLASIMDAVTDIIFVKDLQGRYVHMNQAGARALGKTLDHVLGRDDNALWPPGRAASNRAADRHVLESGQTVTVEEEVSTQGTTTVYLTNKVPYRGPDGHIIGVIGVSRDITARKQAEEALRQRERDLRAALEERERLSQDLHDSILQSLYAIGLGLETCRPFLRRHQRKKVMRILDQSVEQLNSVMREVRAFITGLETELSREQDLSSAIRSMVQALAQPRDRRCRVCIDPLVSRTLTPEQSLHLFSIVKEAMSNSLRHARADQTTVSLRRVKQGVRLTISDNGVGFVPTQITGTGHGLVNMASRATKAGGTFSIFSKPKQGTRVVLDLPQEMSHV